MVYCLYTEFLERVSLLIEVLVSFLLITAKSSKLTKRYSRPYISPMSEPTRMQKLFASLIYFWATCCCVVAILTTHFAVIGFRTTLTYKPVESSMGLL